MEEINLKGQLGFRNDVKRKPKLIILIGFSIIIAAFISYKFFFSNPIGVNQTFYKEHVEAYELMLKAYEEDRKLTSFEKNKLEELEEYWNEEIGKMAKTNVDEQEFQKTLAVRTSIAMMLISFDSAMKDVWDEAEREEKLNEFYIESKTAKAALGIEK